MTKARSALLDLRKIAKVLVKRNGHSVEYWFNKGIGTELIMYAKCEKCGKTAQISVDNETEKMFGEAIKEQCNG